jgi:DUF1707 SHOCT-like domain
MPAPSGPPWTARRRAGAASPYLRVSDADRTSVADELSRHYGDGRLDQAEFSERLDRAMNAKTHADLDGLLADLPGTGAPASADKPPRHPRYPRIVSFVLIIVIAVAAAHALTHFFIPWGWLLLVLLLFVWLRHGHPWRGRDRERPR